MPRSRPITRATRIDLYLISNSCSKLTTHNLSKNIWEKWVVILHRWTYIANQEWWMRLKWSELFSRMRCPRKAPSSPLARPLKKQCPTTSNLLLTFVLIIAGTSNCWGTSTFISSWCNIWSRSINMSGISWEYTYLHVRQRANPDNMAQTSTNLYELHIPLHLNRLSCDVAKNIN